MKSKLMAVLGIVCVLAVNVSIGLATVVGLNHSPVIDQNVCDLPSTERMKELNREALDRFNNGVLLPMPVYQTVSTYGSGIYSDRVSFINGRQHAGEVLDCDLPETEQIRNIGSHVDGAGMCVMSSIEMSARWNGMDELRGLRDWCANERGGGYPSKVTKQIEAFCRAKQIPVPPYLQYEGPDPGPVIEAAAKSGRMACITYGTSPRYMGPIAHMTCCPKFSGRFAVCLDNNFPGESKYEWMDRDELIRRVKYPGSSGWVFVWLTSPPPPSPKN